MRAHILQRQLRRERQHPRTQRGVLFCRERIRHIQPEASRQRQALQRGKLSDIFRHIARKARVPALERGARRSLLGSAEPKPEAPPARFCSSAPAARRAHWASGIMNHAASCGVSRGSCAACASRTAYPSCFAARAGASSKACGTFTHGMGRGCSRFASRDSSARRRSSFTSLPGQEPLCAPHRDLLRGKNGVPPIFSSERR